MTGRALIAVVLALLVPAAALAAFPGSDPDESVRLNTPNDPNFDRCEPDNDGGPTCSNVFDQELGSFGFAPAGTDESATYKNPGETARQQEQNTKAGRNALGQIPGVSADRAWKRSVGRADVQVAILDTGIVWGEEELRRKIALNAGELPAPQRGGDACSSDDCNGDGAFNVDDFADDPRVAKTAGQDDADELLDGSDLIAAFSDGSDADSNGYIDDVAGWDFFDDDNDPFDASSYSSSRNHGTGRAEEAAADTDNGDDGTGVCPRCQIVPLRVWDTFVADTNNFAMGVLYAADNSIEVVEGAVGGLFNSRFAREAFAHAYRRGVFMAIVSSDLNTANHNIPTLYDEAMQVQGTVADAQGLGENPPQPLAELLARAGASTNIPVGTWFRNSGTTQYGGHAHVVMHAVTGSQATGQAAGAAGLVASYGRERGTPLEPNEVKQLLTLTAEDVVPENTVGTGVPDPAQPGWDQHFGYGKPDLGRALEEVAARRIPPQALITSPEWFAPYNVERTASVRIGARLDSRFGGAYEWKLQWAPGIEPVEGDFRDVAAGGGSGQRDAALGTIDLRAVRAALDARPNGGATPDATAPQRDPDDPDPNEPAFTVRVVLTDAAGNRGEDRKMLFAYRDRSERAGSARYLGTGGEASQRLYDLDGDNALDVVQADSSGRLQVLDAAGRPLSSFNGGNPVYTRRYPNVHAAAASYGAVEPPLEVLRTPAIGDIDGDRLPEIVDSAGEHVYAWNHDGSVAAGFPVRIDPARSRPADRTRANHVKRGFAASPTLGDLDGDGRLDVFLPALDQHLYAWTGRGRPIAGFPAKLEDPGEDIPGSESINSAAFGDITGDGRPEIVAATNEVGDAGEPAPPGSPTAVADAVRGIVTNVAANAIGGSGRVYALDRGGKILPGWPVKPNAALPDALPFAGPGVDPALGNVDDDAALEAILAVTTGDVQARNGDGSVGTTYDPTPPTGEHVDKSRVMNLFENPIVANLDGSPGLEVVKGGLTLNQLLNIGVVTGQNLPYSHVVQAWQGGTGTALPAYPQTVEDFQLLSSPAVADTSSAPGYEVVVGTGLYYLRNFNAQGVEGADWPKFTGGWIFAVPAVGDADGDGRLEVAALTREGYPFLWDTDRPACGTNEEWWTSRHDEWSTGAHGTDSRPPGTPRELSARRDGSAVELRWRAPGDDWLCGSADRYQVISSRGRIDEPGDGRAVGEFDAARVRAAAAGDVVERRVRLPDGHNRVAVLYRDDAGNWGRLAAARVGSGSDGDGRGDRDRDGSAGGDGSGPGPDAGAGGTAGAAAATGRLPFTGLVLLVLVAVAGVLLGTGLALRRLAAGRGAAEPR